MGSTPSVIDGCVYFVGFNAKLYCLKAADLSLVGSPTCAIATSGITSRCRLRPDDPFTENPPAAGWSAPLVVGNRIYLGIGEGENPHAQQLRLLPRRRQRQGGVDLLHQPIRRDQINQPNQLPEKVVRGAQLPPGFTVF